MKRGADDAVEVDGELTVKGITQPVSATRLPDRPGRRRPWATIASASSSRPTSTAPLYDLNWNAPLPKGGEALGKKVTLSVHLEFIRQEA